MVVGNWKMNGSLVSNATLLDALVAGAGRLAGRIMVCVPFPYLAQARERLAGSTIEWGAQDVSAHQQGAYTGEVSAGMLREFGCRAVIVGHSERRQHHGESSELVARKAEAALEAGLTPIVCVGETLGERESGKTEAVVGSQLNAVIALLGSRLGQAVVAYEPVWAIGTGRTATPEQAQAVHRILRDRLAGVSAATGNIPLLYGGSVNGANAATLFGCPDIDGGLVGGASLRAVEFMSICDAGVATTKV